MAWEMLPVALAAAAQLDVEQRTFASMVTLSASLSFLTPFEPACLLVHGPGRYRLADFVKSVLPLTGLAFVVLVVMVPRVWPL